MPSESRGKAEASGLPVEYALKHDLETYMGALGASFFGGIAPLEAWRLPRWTVESAPGPFFVPERPASAWPVSHLPTPPDTLEARLRAVELENDKLRIQNENLKSRVAEERRTAARETQRYDQLAAQFNVMLGRLHERSQANDVLQGALLARHDGRLMMFEGHEGEVVHVHGDEVVVVYKIGDDLVEHTYVRDQFIDGQLPKKGDRLAVYVHVAKLPAEPDTAGKIADAEGTHEPPRRRKNVVPLPRTF